MGSGGEKGALVWKRLTRGEFLYRILLPSRRDFSPRTPMEVKLNNFRMLRFRARETSSQILQSFLLLKVNR